MRTSHRQIQAARVWLRRLIMGYPAGQLAFYQSRAGGSSRAAGNDRAPALTDRGSRVRRRPPRHLIGTSYTMTPSSRPSLPPWQTAHWDITAGTTVPARKTGLPSFSPTSSTYVLPSFIA